MRVRDLMTKDVFHVRKGSKLDFVRDVVDWTSIRHVPVVNSADELEGLISQRDLLAAAVSSLAKINEKHQRMLDRSVKAEDIMKTDILTATPGMDLQTAAVMMIENKIGCLPVLEGKKLVGIITESDFLSLADRL